MHYHIRVKGHLDPVAGKTDSRDCTSSSRRLGPPCSQGRSQIRRLCLECSYTSFVWVLYCSRLTRAKRREMNWLFGSNLSDFVVRSIQARSRYT